MHWFAGELASFPAKSSGMRLINDWNLLSSWVSGRRASAPRNFSFCHGGYKPIGMKGSKSVLLQFQGADSTFRVHRLRH